jgi:DNA-binding transcriptional regulator YhcF (GntR family)
LTANVDFVFYPGESGQSYQKGSFSTFAAAPKLTKRLMITSPDLTDISIDATSAVPKYLQLADAIVSGVRAEKYRKGMLMPSINELCNELDISRPTVQKAYKHLQYIKVIDSVPGKCYFITGQTSRTSLQIGMFFNKLSAHKKIIYDAFIDEMGKDVSINLFIYNNEFQLFRSLLEQSSRDYSHYVIIPHFLDNDAEASKIINRIPKHKLLLLDKKIPGITGEYAAVYEHFQEDIFTALTQAGDTLKKYKTIKIVFPKHSYFPREIITGFKLFCKQNNFQSTIITDLAKDETRPGDLYVTLIEPDLVILVQRIVTKKLRLGKDVGIISYNETPIKKIIRDGIATISTDFQKMGQEAARLILRNSRAQVQVPFSLIRRPSL